MFQQNASQFYGHEPSEKTELQKNYQRFFGTPLEGDRMSFKNTLSRSGANILGSSSTPDLHRKVSEKPMGIHRQ